MEAMKKWLYKYFGVKLMNDKKRLESIIKAIDAIGKDTVIPRQHEQLFGILLAQHMISNGFPEEVIVDPDLLMLSIRDAYHEYNWIKEKIKNPTIENVFTRKYIEELKKKGWIYDPNED